MNKIKVLIIDDERYSREELKHLLESFAQIELVGEAETGEKGILKAIQTQPDVAFVDIEMPKMNGLEVANAMKELKKMPFVVFATAFPDFAAKAFRLEAVDYLLKPFEQEEIKETVLRLEKRLFPQSVEEDTPKSSSGKLAIEGVDDITYMDPKQILYIYREDKVTRVVGMEEEGETKMTLKELEERLENFSFFRIHKSYLVNLDFVTRLIPWFNGAYQVEIKGQKEMLPVSRNYAKSLRQKLEL